MKTLEQNYVNWDILPDLARFEPITLTSEDIELLEEFLNV